MNDKAHSIPPTHNFDRSPRKQTASRGYFSFWTKRDTTSGQVVQFGALDVEALLSWPEGTMNDLHPALAVMMQCIQPQVLPLDPSGIPRHVGRDGRRKVFDRTQVASTKIVRVLRGESLDDCSSQRQEIAPAKLVVRFVHCAQWNIKVVAVNVDVDATVRSRLTGHRVSASL
jgi:hypothetical protein